MSAPPDAEGRLRRAVRRLDTFISGGWAIVINEPYEGTRDQREALRSLTSALIGRYIQALKLREVGANPNTSSVVIDTQLVDEVKILKQITKDYIIRNPALLAQQEGQKPPAYLPTRLIYLWGKDIRPPRFVADCISSLTEAEAVGLCSHLHGWSSGSVLDPIVR
jgi:dGTPase